MTGPEIRAIRDSLGLSQSKFAQAIAARVAKMYKLKPGTPRVKTVAITVVSRWERGVEAPGATRMRAIELISYGR